MTALRQRRPSVEVTAYRKALRNQPCVVSGFEYSEMGGMGVDPAHISMENFARGMKADDWHCLPMRHDLHLEFDKNQFAFLLDLLSGNKHMMAEVWKGYAKWRYIRWVLDTNGDVAEAVKEIARDD